MTEFGLLVSEKLPKFEWFIIKYFGDRTLDMIKSNIENKEDSKLSALLTNIWFALPDKEFNIIENPPGWKEFLSIIDRE